MTADEYRGLPIAAKVALALDDMHARMGLRLTRCPGCETALYVGDLARHLTRRCPGASVLAASRPIPCAAPG